MKNDVKKEIKDNIIKNNNVIVDINLKIMKLYQLLSLVFDYNNNSNDDNVLYFEPEWFKVNSSKIVDVIKDIDKVIQDKLKFAEKMKDLLSEKNEPKQSN